VHARPFEVVATLLYTSGTSGRAEGRDAVRREWLSGDARNFIYGNNVTMRSVFLCDMPLFHTAGLYAASRVPIQAGGCVLISKGFDPHKTLERLSDPTLKVTHYFSVPQMAATIWNQPGFKPEMLHGLVGWAHRRRAQPQGADSAFRECRHQDHRRLRHVGDRFPISACPTHDIGILCSKAGSCGLPFMTIEPKIVEDDGNEVPVGSGGRTLAERSLHRLGLLESNRRRRPKRSAMAGS